MEQIKPDEFRRIFPNASASTIARNNQAGGVASSPVAQPRNVDEPLAEDEGKAVDQVRRLVRVTLCRRRLLDDDNPYPKHFIDAIKEAGLIVDDSPRWCKIEVVQRLVYFAQGECTVIEITPIETEEK